MEKLTCDMQNNVIKSFHATGYGHDLILIERYYVDLKKKKKNLMHLQNQQVKMKEKKVIKIVKLCSSVQHKRRNSVFFCPYNEDQRDTR